MKIIRFAGVMALLVATFAGGYIARASKRGATTPPPPSARHVL
jgi:hypothetical protein